MKAPEFTRSGSSHSTRNLLPGKRSNPIRKYCCTVPDYIYFLENSALVGLALSLLRRFIHTVEIENPDNGHSFKVNGQRLKPFLEHFNPQEHNEDLVDPLYQHSPSK